MQFGSTPVTAAAIAQGLGFTLSGTAGQTYTFPAASATLATLGANTFAALQTITQASANAGILASTGYSLTGSSTVSMSSYTGTLNTSGVVDLVKYAITDTAHGAGSTFLRILGGAAGATNMFSVNPDGSITVGAAGASGSSSFQGGATFNNSVVIGLPGAGVATLTSTGYSVTGSQTVSQVNFTGTLNTSGVVDVLKYAITDTAHGAGSNLLALYGGVAGATLKFSVDTSGAIAGAKVTTSATDFMCNTSGTLASGAAAQVGTLTNGPTAGNPTKWIAVNDNGTTRYIPAW